MYCKSSFRFFSLLLIIVLVSSCSPLKNIAYLQSTATQSTKQQGNVTDVFNAVIKPKDLLSITVVTSVPEASRMYNLTVPQISDLTSQNSINSQPSLQPYLVNTDGDIDFPVFGKLSVAGLTTKQLQAQLQEKLASAFSKERPVVTIRIINYSVNVVGEVLRPGKFVTTNERITIFEGLAMAGDMSIYGRRDNVKVLREGINGQKQIITVNLNDAGITSSPAYYLEQNDVVYVEPNKSRSNSSRFGAAESFGISALSVLFSLTSLVFTIVKK